MNTHKPSPAAKNVPLPLKGKALVLVASLAFILLALSMVAGVIEGPMFRDKARARLDQLQARFAVGDTASGIQSDLSQVMDQVRREKALINRYMIFAVLMAVANALLAIRFIGRSRSPKKFILGMGLAGIFWGLALSGLYVTMHARVLPGGLQDPAFPRLLSLCLLAFSVANGLFVAAIALRMSKPK